MKAAVSVQDGTSKVLVADHDAKSRDNIGSILSSAGYDVLLLESLDQLAAYSRRATRCCLVMDYRLQGMNGLDLWIQLSGRRADLPVVFVSAHANVAVAVRAIKAGAIDFLAKPVCEEALLDAVQAALEQDALRRARLNALEHVETLYGALSPREREVMWHVTAGLMNKQVAGILGLSEITVKVHRGNVMRKMNARTFADLVKKADILPDRRSGPGNELPFMEPISVPALPAFHGRQVATRSVHA